METVIREQRLFERFSARFPVKYKYTPAEFGSDVFLRDASASGAKITTRQRLYLHDSVSLVVQLPDGAPPLELNGRVVWLKAKEASLWEAGCEFYKVNFMKMHRIFKWVQDED